MTKSIRFKVGMTVKINSEYTGINGSRSQALDQFGYKKGDKVELLKYDHIDETWHITSKDLPSIWIKRKNLAPITEKKKTGAYSHPPKSTSTPFKIGDKVELINPEANWASSDNVTTGVQYTVTQVTGATQTSRPYIKVKGGDALGTYWIECQYFKLHQYPWNIGDRFKAGTDRTIYTIKEGRTASTVIISWGKSSERTSGSTSYDKRTVTDLINSGVWNLIGKKEAAPKAKAEPKPKVMQAVCINQGSYSLKITNGQIYNVQEAGSIGGDKFFTVLNPNGGRDPFKCWQERFTVITEPAKAETPAPVAQAPKKRFAVCIDMSDSTAYYTVGNVYEIKGERDKYFDIVADDKGRDGSGMYKSRFKEITEPTVTAVQTPVLTHNDRNTFKVGDKVKFIKANMAASFYGSVSYYTRSLEDGGIYTVTVAKANNTSIIGQDKAFIEIDASEYYHPYDCFELVVEEKPIVPAPKKSEYTIPVVCNKNEGYEGRLTIGKTYMARKNSSELYAIETDDKGNKPGYTVAYMKRFTVVTDEPKVGDTLTAQWLNSKTPRQFHGYGYRSSWESKAVGCFGGDRTILKIDIVDGRRAALISGTSNIWIDMAELTKKTEAQQQIPDIAKEIHPSVMEPFLIELNTLMQKYK